VTVPLLPLARNATGPGELPWRPPFLIGIVRR
jgi:hypothetical protein